MDQIIKVVVDTNILIEDLKLMESFVNRLKTQNTITLHIPLTVVNELDGLKVFTYHQ
jgi:rRNA-processing protein FCF1